MESTKYSNKALSHKKVVCFFSFMQCAYNLVPHNLNGRVSVIALKQQEQSCHVKSARQSRVTSRVHLCRKVVHSDSLETKSCTRTDCVTQLI